MKTSRFFSLFIVFSHTFLQAQSFPLPVSNVKSVTEWVMETKVSPDSGSSAKPDAKATAPTFEQSSFLEYDVAGKVVTSTSFEGKTATTREFSYGKTGLLEREQIRSGEGPTAMVRYSYDASGNLLKVIHEENGKLSGTKEYRRSNAGKDVLMLTVDADGTVKEAERSIRDDSDRTLVSSRFDAEGAILSETLVCHDNGGRITRKAVSGSDAEPSWTEWQYSGDGRLVSVTEKTPDGLAVVFVERYAYDERGVLVETVTERYDGNPDSRVRHSYKVDSRGNWILREDVAVEEKFGVEYAVTLRSVRRDIVYRR